MPLAILEEVGIFGAGAVLAWLYVLTRGAARRGIAASVVFWTALVTNMGESTLFSPGGLGLLMLILIAWASTESSADARVSLVVR
jgi:hypothetical protein